MDRLRICFVGSARYTYPLDETSRKKFSFLKDLGELFVIGFSREYRWRQFKQGACFYLLPELPLAILRYAEMFVLAPLLILGLIFRHRLQILVAQSPYEGFVAALAKKLARLCGYELHLVIESHGDFEESLFLQRRIMFAHLYRFLMRYAARVALREANALRAISEETRQQLKQWAPQLPICKFPAWTDMKVFLEASFKREATTEENILYVGVLIPRKGVHHLINAFVDLASDHPETRLILIGHEANKSYGALLRQMVREQGLDGSVRFLEALPQADLAVWMSKARVLVLPSLSEGLGRVVIEAMATSTPVIGSCVGGIPEMVADGVNGLLVTPGDEVALAKKIRYMVEHPHKASEMGWRAHVFARQFFSTEVFVQGYAELFAEVMQAACRGGR